MTTGSCVETKELSEKDQEILEQIQALKNICEDEGWRFRDDYVGRAMYGSRGCVGIDTDSPVSCIELAAQAGIRGARIDSMGMDSIVYWTRIKLPESMKTQSELEEAEDANT